MTQAFRRRFVPAAIVVGMGCGPTMPLPEDVPPAVISGLSVTTAAGGHLEADQATVAASGAVVATDVTASTPAVGSAPSLDVKAPHSDWDLRAHKVRFDGGVTVKRGDVTMLCDVLEVSFDSPDHLERAIASGHVQVEKGSRHATGERAELDSAAGTVVLTGTPTVTDGASRMLGVSITFQLDDERVSCEQCQLTVAGGAVRPR